MNAHETTEIRELTATELNEVNGGVTFIEWLLTPLRPVTYSISQSTYDALGQAVQTVSY